MFGKMMNSFYYGKSGKGDYRKEDLPKNRWQLFFEMLKVRLSGLVRLNLLYVLIWVPAIILIVMTLMAAMAQLNEMVTETGALQGDVSVFSGLLSTGLLLLIPCIAITGPFTAGVAYVTRNWARDEHSFIWSDFKDALKANWKQALLTSVVSGVMPFVVYVGYMTYGEMIRTSGAFFVVPQVLLVMLGVIWSLMTLYMYPLMITYKLTNRQLVKNALLLAVGRLPQSLGLRLMSALPLVIALLVVYMTFALEIVMLVMVALYALFLLAFNRFCYASYSNAVFDKYINVHIEGVEVNRGMNLEEDDDEDDESQQ